MVWLTDGNKAVVLLPEPSETKMPIPRSDYALEGSPIMGHRVIRAFWPARMWGNWFSLKYPAIQNELVSTRAIS